MHYEPSENFARTCDLNDPLSHFRERFHIPQKNGKDSIYFCGNSLGLQSRNLKDHILTELDSWEKLGVEGHFMGPNPWADYHWLFKSSYSRLLGATEEEVTVMNSLSANLHLMMVSFYRPRDRKKKIMMEAGAFPSDQYAVETQVLAQGLNPAEDIIELSPREGTEILETDHIIDAISRHADELALILLPGVQYYSGQFFDISAISKAARKHDITIGWDLAHAVGNLPLRMHDSGADFAVWCCYKYLNSGPGGIGGIFVHERHANNPDLPRFAGWWGHKEDERFKMKKGFIPMKGADGWQVSNKNILSLAAQKASLEIFDEAGIEELRKKSLKLTGYLEYLLRTEVPEQVKIISPEDPEARGCQLSLVVKDGRKIFDKLTENGVIADWREPDVIRIAPVPLYNRFMDVFDFVKVIKQTLSSQ